MVNESKKDLRELLLSGAGWQEVAAALKDLLETTYDDYFWAQLAQRIEESALNAMLSNEDWADRGLQLHRVFGDRMHPTKEWLIGECYKLCWAKPDEDLLSEEIAGLKEQLALALCQNAELRQEIESKG